MGKRVERGYVQHTAAPTKTRATAPQALRDLSSRVKQIIQRIPLGAGRPPSFSSRKPRMSREVSKTAQRALK